MSSFFMDSITQAVLGVTVAHIGFNQRTNKLKTVLFGALVASLPDLDVYISKLADDPLTEVEMHRGLSHSVLFFLFLALFVTFLTRKYFPKIAFYRLYATSFFILLTHSLLDVFTTWGTQLFWWYPEKYALKSIFVVDLFYTIPLLIGVYWGLKMQKIRYTVWGMSLSTLYLFWGLVAQNWIKNETKQAFSSQFQIEVQQLTVKPTFSNSILWNVIIQTDEGFYLSDRSIFDKEPMEFQFYPHRHHLIKNLNSDQNIQRLVAISENQFIITENQNGLVFNDLRFGLLKKDDTAPQFAFSYQLLPTNTGVRVQELPKDRRDGKQLLIYLWNRIF